MKRKLCAVLALIMACLMIFAGCSAELKMATGGTTGTYYAYGGTIAQMYADKTDINVTIHSSGASKANVFEVVDGEADIALVQNDVAYYAYNGQDLFASEGAVKGFSAMVSLYPEVCQIVSTTEITSIEDLKGKKVSVGDAGSGVEFNARQILAAYGITFDDIQVANLSFGDSATALKDGQIDAFFCVAGAPTTAIVDLCTSKEINLLSVDDEHAAALAAEYPFYSTFTIEAGTYSSVKEDVQTVAVQAMFIVSDKLSEDQVYNMTKALFENKDAIAHDKAKLLSIETATSGIGIPFHPGAEKYLKEVGAM